MPYRHGSGRRPLKKSINYAEKNHQTILRYIEFVRCTTHEDMTEGESMYAIFAMGCDAALELMRDGLGGV